jgi:hypothetical protein
MACIVVDNRLTILNLTQPGKVKQWLCNYIIIYPLVRSMQETGNTREHKLVFVVKADFIATFANMC